MLYLPPFCRWGGPAGIWQPPHTDLELLSDVNIRFERGGCQRIQRGLGPGERSSERLGSRAMPRARECEHIGPGEKTFAFIPMSHCSFSLIKGAMRTADKTYGFDFGFSSNGGLYHESQSHQTKPLTVLHLIHLVCVTDKVHFRAILPTLLPMDPLGVGSRITSFADICKQSFSGNATDVGVWNPLTSNYRKLKEYLIIPPPHLPHRGTGSRYPSCSTLFQISKWEKLHSGWKAATMLP